MENLLKRKIFIMAMLVTFIFAGSTFAADIDLGEDYHVPSIFTSVLITSSDGTAIQNAIDHIQDGGTILLSGNFNLRKNINIKKNLIIKGSNNDKTILDGTATNDRVIRCQGNITLENLTIKGGNSTNGGGVKLDGGKVNIISCDIIGNNALLGGGGIHSQADTLTLINCNISNNSVSAFGGGMSFLGLGTVTMTNCIINNNTAAYGGGLAVTGNNITMNNCQVTANEADNSGGGVLLLGNIGLTANSCDISGNTAPESQDIQLRDGAIFKEEK